MIRRSTDDGDPDVSEEPSAEATREGGQTSIGTMIEAVARLPSWARTLSSGTLVASRYRIEKRLGGGGMGEVYEAVDLLSTEHVALKTIHPTIDLEGTIAARFVREMQVARKVTHRNVCRIFDLGMHDKAPFITMELLVGETLSARLARGMIDLETARSVAVQLALALSAAHEVGIIHRDLKPANVMLVELPAGGVRAVVTDFGLARPMISGGDDLTAAGAVLGTPSYMAPEQVEGKSGITAAADVYALGVVLYEITTGRLPFVGETPLATMTMRLNVRPRSPRELRRDLSRQWEAAILRCLERDPSKRFHNAASVADALRPTRDSRIPWRLVGSFAAIVGGVTVWWLVQSEPTRPSPENHVPIVVAPEHKTEDDLTSPTLLALGELLVRVDAGVRFVLQQAERQVALARTRPNVPMPDIRNRPAGNAVRARECKTNPDGSRSCGFDCQVGGHGRYYCSQVPKGRCDLNADGTRTCW